VSIIYEKRTKWVKEIEMKEIIKGSSKQARQRGKWKQDNKKKSVCVCERESEWVREWTSERVNEWERWVREVSERERGEWERERERWVRERERWVSEWDR
jgi:hypothetical protein